MEVVWLMILIWKRVEDYNLKDKTLHPRNNHHISLLCKVNKMYHKTH